MSEMVGTANRVQGWTHSDGLFHPFDKLSVALRDAAFPYPSLAAAPDLLLVSDYGGEHKEATHSTYTFAVIDCLTLRAWDMERRRARRHDFSRRMAYKNLRASETYCTRLLPGFLSAADHLRGALATFAVSKTLGGDLLSSPEDPFVLERLTKWPLEVQQRILRVAAFASFLICGFASANQNIEWLSDADRMIPNAEKHTAFLELIEFTSMKYFLRKPMGALTIARVEAASGREPDLFMEDLLSIPDLVTGALAENSVRDKADRLRLNLAAGAEKAVTILSWHFKRRSGLLPIAISIDPHVTEPEICEIGFFHD